MLLKRLHILLFIYISIPVYTYSQPATDQPWSVRMAESVMLRHPGTYGSWNYVTGTVLRGFEELWRAGGDDRYYDFIKNTVDRVVNENDSFNGFRLTPGVYRFMYKPSLLASRIYLCRLSVENEIILKKKCTIEIIDIAVFYAV